MPDIGEYLDNMVVTTTSQDRNIRARISNYTDVEVRFRPGTFDRYDERRLGEQLSRLGLTSWVAYHRGRSQAYQKALGLSDEELAEAERPTTDPHRRRYEEELNEVEGVGVSASGVVQVRTKGMMRWQVTIKPGAIAKLTEQQFLAEAHAAITALFSDREMKIILLKAKYFDLGIPRAWLDRARQFQAETRHRR
ncbi:MAG: hypothetical protein JXA67_14055 [Micromonosporaceae bacterium]|nr:hypothetical protein [Micromonosporaceae bacterium]